MQDKLFSRSEGSTLNSLRRRIDRFCVLHPNFGIPNLMLYIVIGNIAFYLLSLFSPLDGGSLYAIPVMTAPSAGSSTPLGQEMGCFALPHSL